MVYLFFVCLFFQKGTDIHINQQNNRNIVIIEARLAGITNITQGLHVNTVVNRSYSQFVDVSVAKEKICRKSDNDMSKYIIIILNYFIQNRI